VAIAAGSIPHLCAVGLPKTLVQEKTGPTKNSLAEEIKKGSIGLMPALLIRQTHQVLGLAFKEGRLLEPNNARLTQGQAHPAEAPPLFRQLVAAKRTFRTVLVNQ